MSQARGHESHVSTPCETLDTYRTILYDRALHPELFQLRDRRVIADGRYGAEVWLMRGAHLIRFGTGSLQACELVTDRPESVPSSGAVSAFLCAGEREFEHEFKDRGVRYIFAVQTESLTENLYAGTYEEMLEHARESGSLSHRWDDGSGSASLSVLDVQRYAREIHAQAYHLLGRDALVIRTQTIFEKP